MKLDVLAIGVHPDDVELGAGATVAKMVSQGYKVGILDLTMGQLGTRGTSALRLEESKASADILGVSIRHNLGMEDGFFRNDAEHQELIIEQIRRFEPKIILCNAPSDRHPDHGRASQLTIDACFYSGLSKLETEWEGKSQLAWRPEQIYHYIQFNSLKPDVVVDISGFEDVKMEALMAFGSQFYNPDSTEPETIIATKDFMDSTRARLNDYGRLSGTKAGEGFIIHRLPAVNDLFDLK